MVGGGGVCKVGYTRWDTQGGLCEVGYAGWVMRDGLRESPSEVFHSLIFLYIDGKSAWPILLNV